MTRPKYHIGQQIVYNHSTGSEMAVIATATFSGNIWIYKAKDVESEGTFNYIHESHIIYYLRDTGHWAAASGGDARARTI